jgi:FAD-dependent oxidoreductase domain-containing protein 1
VNASYDVVIVGGAVHGASLAYHLAASRFTDRVLLIEKDPTFRFAATALSAGSIRQQFSTPVNIAISLFGIEFLRDVGTRLEVDGERPEIGLREGGYLFLATPAGAETLARNQALQTNMGADILHLDPDGLRQRFPWIATDGVAAGCWGHTGEGWFDGYSLMQALRRKAFAMGVTGLAGEVAEIEKLGDRAIGVHLADGTRIAAGSVAVTAGPATRSLLAPIGIALPVEARKRMVFTFACRERLPDFPLLIDPTGVYVRPEGDLYLCGSAPPPDQDLEATDFEVDHAFFDETIWPVLANRVPAFERIRPGRAWAGHYDMNLLDHNAIVGSLPGFANVFVAVGFSGHGLQQAPAVGRGLAELIAGGRYATLDLSPLGYDRIAARRPLLEQNVV